MCFDFKLNLEVILEMYIRFYSSIRVFLIFRLRSKHFCISL